MKHFELCNYLHYVGMRVCILANTSKGATRWANANGFYDRFNYIIELA